NDVAEAYPEEPAVWANLGVFAMRQGNYPSSEEYFQKALDLVPGQPDILFLRGLLQRRTGQIEEAIRSFRNALESDPRNLMIRYALIRELERRDDTRHAEEIMESLEEMRAIAPENQILVYETARIAAKEQNLPLLEKAMDALADFSGKWDEDARNQYETTASALESGNFNDVALELSFLRNAIEPEPSFQEDLARLQIAPAEIGYTVNRFLWLPQPELQVAEPDHQLRFDEAAGADFPETSSFIISLMLREDLPPLTVHLAHSQVRIDQNVILDYPGEITGRAAGDFVLTGLDYNYNFMTDIAMAGNQGFRLYRQNEDYTFTDVTSDLDLSGEITDSSYTGIWNTDYDQDGDLDLVLARENGGVIFLRNNSDGTFAVADPFPELEDVITDFKWADLHGSGTPDAVFLTGEGALILYRNSRRGTFARVGDLPVQSAVSAVEIADIDADGSFEIIAAKDDQSMDRLYYQRETDSWEAAVIAGRGLSGPGLSSGSRLFTPDLDNNGAFDLLLSGKDRSWIWLAGEDQNYRLLDQELPGGLTDVVDIEGNERLDLLGITEDGSPYQLFNRGTRDYGARSIRARASGATGDQRINSFGIGGEMEIRSGLLYQKQLISSPIVHFGLGLHEEAEMLRIIWPNGSVQSEFAELGMESTIFNEQILKGSCPWLFAHDGNDLQFVTDVLWRSPLGLRINARETAGVTQTLDRVKIPGSMLSGRDGLYDVRITAELWETHFFDHVELTAYDHPPGTEIHIDERFTFPAPDLSVQLTKTPRPVSRVFDQHGQDVSEIVEQKDGNYLKAFTRGSYQGLANEHFIEIVLGDEVPLNAPLLLIATGWLRPTDSSVNLALSQGSHNPPEGLKIEVTDGHGGWKLLHDDYGVPAGKLKTILLNLDGVFADPADRRIRMHTTSEIYWDAIRWAESLSEEKVKEYKPVPARQELRYRGYSTWTRADSLSPKLPDYNKISGTAPRWRDLTGFHTRFGSVRELLAETDGRYVIMNAGDELLLEYTVPADPEEGWTRSFVFDSAGWVKDGDYNTEASATVGPLPYHEQTDYSHHEEFNLSDDPVFQRHRSDWQKFHTRYITPQPFRSALIFE
ncbi:MAG: FG-GAP-like repeat-containing protein, partial [Balneolaceae bacterium]